MGGAPGYILPGGGGMLGGNGGGSEDGCCCHGGGTPAAGCTGGCYTIEKWTKYEIVEL